MLNRILATVVFLVLHVAFYFLLRSFLSGTAFVLAVYGCTVVSFVFLDALLLKAKHKNREVKRNNE